jgi:hypothetical protein
MQYVLTSRYNQDFAYKKKVQSGSEKQPYQATVVHLCHHLNNRDKEKSIKPHCELVDQTSIAFLLFIKRHLLDPPAATKCHAIDPFEFQARIAWQTRGDFF